MGHVRLTAELRQDIESKVLKPFTERLAALNQSIAKDPVFAEAAYCSTVPTELRSYLENTINKDPAARQWIRTVDTLRVQVDTPSGGKLVFMVTPAKPVPIPVNTSQWNNWVTISFSHPAYIIVKERIEKMEAIEKEVVTLRTALLTPVFSNCKTVGQAIKLWPSIIDFLPLSAREQFYSRPSQQSSVDLKGIEIDEDAKHLLTKARMLTQ
jgi:hypothetical protein